MSYSIEQLIIIILRLILTGKTDVKAVTKDVADRYGVSFCKLWDRIPNDYK